MVEFEASDNPTLFAIKLGSTHTWLGMELHMDAHIGAAMTLERVSKQREEARDIVDKAKIRPNKNRSHSFEKPSEKMTAEEDSSSKEDTMLKVLESMSRKIEDLEKTTKENYTTSSMPNIRGQDFRTPSTSTLVDQPQKRDGIYLMEQLPRVGYFSGEKPTPKGEIDFKTWKSDVTGNLQNYPELSLRPGIRSSLRGNAKELLEGLPTGATVREIVDMLTRQYGTVESSDQLLATFYQLSQNKGEEIANFAARLVGTLNKIQKRYPHLVPFADRERQLRDRLFHGMLKPYRDALRYLYNNQEVGYYDFLEEARKVQECDEKSSTTIKSKSAQVDDKNDELAALKLQVAELTATLKATKVNGPPYKGKGNGKDSRDLKGPEKSAAGPFRGRDRPFQCFKCHGWGHLARDCPSPENYRWGESDNHEPPPPGRRPLEQQGNPTRMRNQSQAPNQTQNHNQQGTQ